LGEEGEERGKSCRDCSNKCLNFIWHLGPWVPVFGIVILASVLKWNIFIVCLSYKQHCKLLANLQVSRVYLQYRYCTFSEFYSMQDYPYSKASSRTKYPVLSLELKKLSGDRHSKILVIRLVFKLLYFKYRRSDNPLPNLALNPSSGVEPLALPNNIDRVIVIMSPTGESSLF
jgi:hypothetical protein